MCLNPERRVANDGPGERVAKNGQWVPPAPAAQRAAASGHVGPQDLPAVGVTVFSAHDIEPRVGTHKSEGTIDCGDQLK